MSTEVLALSVDHMSTPNYLYTLCLQWSVYLHMLTICVHCVAYLHVLTMCLCWIGYLCVLTVCVHWNFLLAAWSLLNVWCVSAAAASAGTAVVLDVTDLTCHKASFWASRVEGSRTDKLGPNIHMYDKGQETVKTVTNTGSSIKNRTRYKADLMALHVLIYNI